jgi:hypothetical protein
MRRMLDWNKGREPVSGLSSRRSDWAGRLGMNGLPSLGEEGGDELESDTRGGSAQRTTEGDSDPCYDRDDEQDGRVIDKEIWGTPM